MELKEFTKKLESVLKIGMNSPSKRKTLDQMLVKYKLTKENKIQSELLQLQSYKSKNRKEFASLRVKLLRKYRLMKTVSEKAQVHYQKVKRLFSPPHSKVTLRKQRSNERKKQISNFFVESKASVQLPDMKFAKKRFLISSLKETYTEYLDDSLEKGEVPFAFSTFCKLKPQHVKTYGKTPSRMCLCQLCENCSMYMKGMRGNNVQSTPRNLADAVSHTQCPVADDQQYAKLSCIRGECDHCGVGLLSDILFDSNPDIALDKTMIWHQWNLVMKANGKNTPSFVEVTGTFENMVYNFCQNVELLGLHLFTATWQNRMARAFRNNLRKGTLFQILDFGQNYLNRFQDEIQSQHWDHNQTTIHPIVNYYCCPKECGNIVTHEQIFITDDITHDHYAVDHFVGIGMGDLKKMGISVTNLVQATDNCKNHYKSKGPFETLTKRKMPTMRIFYGERHGKSEADGVTGRCKQAVERARLSRQAIMTDAEEVHIYCQSKLQTTIEEGSDNCQHFIQTFHFVKKGEINRNWPVLKTGIKKSSLFHQIRSTGVPYVLEARPIACLCNSCYWGEGKCPNARYIDDWKVYKLKRAPFVKNKQYPLKIKVPLRRRKSTPAGKSDDNVRIADAIADGDVNIPDVRIADAIADADVNIPDVRIADAIADADVDIPDVSIGDAIPQLGIANDKSNKKLPVIAVVNASNVSSSNHSSLRRKCKNSTVADPIADVDCTQFQMGMDWDGTYRKIMSCKTFDDLAKFVSQLESIPTVPYKQIVWNPTFFVDLTAMQYKPKNVPTNLLPADTDGDGNCFFRTLSVLIFGHEEFHKALRVLYVIEAVTNYERYIDNDYLSLGSQRVYKRGSTLEVIIAYSQVWKSSDTRRIGKQVASDYFKREVMLVRKEGAWCGLWEMAVMVNVLQVPIRGFYPNNVSETTRQDFDRSLMPFEKVYRNRTPVNILWTPGYTGGPVEHFVPLLVVCK